MTTAEKPIITTSNLTKNYANKVAVDRLNLEIRPGTVFGLLGPNGAGKTTIILMLLGLSEPSGGTATVGGYDSTKNSLAVKSVTGYLPDDVGFYNELSGRENLSYTAALNGFPPQRAREKIEAALERVQLVEAADRKVGAYSHGMRQRLGIADLLVKDPQLLILDEPTLGLDPEGTEDLLNLIVDLARKDGRTILLSSHLLHQVQRICDEVGILVRGRLVARGTLADLENQLMGDTVYIELAADPGGRRLVDFCREFAGVMSVREQGEFLLLQCSGDMRGELVKRLFENGFLVRHLQLKGFSLDDIYHRYFRKEGDYAQEPVSSA